jgi:2-methylisocitrate lyase-like PEP mutase family enzyme
VGVVAVTLLGLAVPSWSSDLEPRRWASALDAVDEALACDDVGAAVRAWRTAVGVARGERHWEGLVAVGDASLRIGAIPRIHELPEAGARSLYVEALFRARQQRSLRGIVQVAERFAWLGDMEVVARSLRMTNSLVPTVAADAETLAALEILRVRSILRLSQAREGTGGRP